MQKDNIYELIAKKLSGEINKLEEKELDNWLFSSGNNKELYQKFVNIWTKSDEYGEDFNPDITQAIIKYKKRVKKAEQARFVKVRRMRIIQLAAAAVLLFFFFYFLTPFVNSDELVVVSTDSSEIRHIILPDSSVVYLNRNTELEYLNDFEERKLNLKGEAFFEVKKKDGRSFIVVTGNTKVLVLGTSFNVKARGGKNNTELAVLTGKVQFSAIKSGVKKVLIPSEQATFNANTSKIVKSELKDKNFLAWKTGILNFDNSSLEYILQTLSENYDLKYDFEDDELKDLNLTCEFVNQEIENILFELEILLPIKIKMQARILVIEKN